MLPQKDLVLTDDLPDDIAAGVGRSIAVFSLLEVNLKALVYALSGVEHGLGMLVIRAHRASDLFEMVEDLLAFRGLTVGVPEDVIKRVKADLRTCNERRDMLAHAAFALDPDTNQPHLVLTVRVRCRPPFCL